MFSIDITSKDPIYKQLEKNIIQYVSLNILKPHDQLPSVRNLAQELHVNPNTVQKAYASLEQKNIIYIVSGRGAFVSEQCSHIAAIKTLIKQKLKDISKEATDIGISLEEQQEIIKTNFKG